MNTPQPLPEPPIHGEGYIRPVPPPLSDSEVLNLWIDGQAAEDATLWQTFEGTVRRTADWQEEYDYRRELHSNGHPLPDGALDAAMKERDRWRKHRTDFPAEWAEYCENLRRHNEDLQRQRDQAELEKALTDLLHIRLRGPGES